MMQAMSRFIVVRFAAAAALCVAFIATNLPGVHAAGYAPVNRPGPALKVSRAALNASLFCPGRLSEVTREVVLLIPGTTVDPVEAYGWNYAIALKNEGIPYCWVTLPNHTDGDIQIAAEYIVDAVRTIRAATNRRVVLFGWSQGASTLPRWAIRFWPDIRPMIASLVGLAPLNNKGSIVSNAPCLGGRCIPAAWQQSIGSNFMAALNSGQQTFPGIAYTMIYSRTDEVVTPNVNGGLSKLPLSRNVVNVALQDVCPTDLSEHIAIVASPAAYAVALEAFRHPGRPADLKRVRPPKVCVAGRMPGVTPINFVTETARIGAQVGPHLITGMVDKEPPLASYVRG